jgi:hypothetical protein
VGDTNCDGVVDFADIDPLVLALADPVAYQAQFPDCDLCTADINGDGVADFLDIDPFVACLSNGGCGQRTCPPEGACCLSNGLCLQTLALSCDSDGGTYLGDYTTCAPHPCPVPTGACCYPDNSCVETDAVTCLNVGGTYRGDRTSCGPNPCTLPLGACCYASGSCVETDELSCEYAGAQYQGDTTTCATIYCPLPVGACCYPNGSCAEADQNTCENEGARYQGDGTSCTPNPCPVFGACCLADGTCIEVELLDCLFFFGGYYQGDNTSCTPNPCPIPTGACCYPNGSCAETDEMTCTQEGAVYRGDGTSCTPNPCPPPIGACCYPNGSCAETDPTTCENEGAVYQGDGSNCTLIVCPSPTGACCFLGTCAVTNQVTCEFYRGTYQGDGTSCTPNPCPICVVPPAPPDPLAVGPSQPGRLRTDILVRNVIRGGSGALFPAAPDSTLQRDGVPPANFATVRLGIDTVDGWDLRGRIYYPATAGGQDTPVAGGGPFPLVVIAHGRHSSLRLPHGPTVIVNDENYRGYIYLQEHLARHGFISLSLDLDDVVEVDRPAILSRAWIVLCHLRNMESINGTVGHRLRNQIDMNNILLMGHSRGGEAVVQATRMNLDGTGPYGTLQADPANRRRFNIRAVFSLAATRFFDGTKNWDPAPAPVPADRLPPAPESRVATPGRTPFLGMWGDADGDVSGMGGITLAPAGFPAAALYTITPDGLAPHVAGTYDRSDADPKQFVWIEGANHNFWNTSWYDLTRAPGLRGDDGERNLGAGVVNLVPNRITDAQQEDLLRAYGLAFVRGYLFADATALDYRRYFKGPANTLPPVAIARTNAHLQYQDTLPNREVVDDFEDATFDRDGTSRGVGGIDRTTVIVQELRLQRGATPSSIDTRPPPPIVVGDTYPDRSWFHNTIGTLIQWSHNTDYYETVCPPGGGAGTDARPYDVLSFRIALDVRGPGAAPALDVEVRLQDGGGRQATVRTTTITTIPVGQRRRDSIFGTGIPATPLLTKSMLKTVRLPLCRFRENNRALDLSDVRRIRFTFFDRAAGKIGLDDIEFSR